MLPLDARNQLAVESPAMFSRIIFAGMDIRKLLTKIALIGGAGGLGVIVGAILARSGIGKLIIIDRDIVEEENFNRLVYNRDDAGKPKAQCLAQKLESIRNASDIAPKFHLKTEAYQEDVVAWMELEELIQKSDIIFTCFDNEAARVELNAYATVLGKPLIDGGTSENALRGTIITVLPGKTPCLECYWSINTLISIDDIDPDEQELKSSILKVPCGASLATTMNIVGSLQTEQAFKILLEYGEIVPLIRISLEDSFYVTKTHPKRRTGCPACGDL
ncbi:MAG: ThiF family adenylyltransferase [Candidatus Helarchaeota archaeon]|nr:ThiF family adenylyltransferase [Candidatus Helarchaeota archaeon]